MPATLATIIHPVGAKTSASLRILTAGWERIARYVVHRAAIASLRELDDRALHDIGLERSQIEAAVRGVMIPRRRARA